MHDNEQGMVGKHFLECFPTIPYWTLSDSYNKL